MCAKLVSSDLKVADSDYEAMSCYQCGSLPVADGFYPNLFAARGTSTQS